MKFGKVDYVQNTTTAHDKIDKHCFRVAVEYGEVASHTFIYFLVFWERLQSSPWKVA